MQLEQWKKYKYFNAGTYLGQLEKLFHNDGSGTNERNELAPAHFWAGRYAAIFGDDMTDHILTCFQPSIQLTDALYKSMETKIKIRSGYETIDAAKALFDTAL